MTAPTIRTKPKRARKCKAEEMPFDAAHAAFHAHRLAPHLEKVIIARLIDRTAWADMPGGAYKARRDFADGVEAVRKWLEWHKQGFPKKRRVGGPRKGDML